MPCHTVRNLTWTAHCRINSMPMPMPWARVKDQRKTKLLFSFTFRRHFFRSQPKLWGWSSLSNYGHLSLTLFTFHPMPTAQLPVEKNTQVQVHVARGKIKMLGFSCFSIAGFVYLQKLLRPSSSKKLKYVALFQHFKQIKLLLWWNHWPQVHCNRAVFSAESSTIGSSSSQKERFPSKV